VYERGGGGVEADPQQAVACYREAAEQGDARAQMNLGRMYFDAAGVPRDFVEAYKWFYLSSKNGDPIALHYLHDLQGNNQAPAFRPTPEQMAQAEREANAIDQRIRLKSSQKPDIIRGAL
jgi:TPR repeat protein